MVYSFNDEPSQTRFYLYIKSIFEGVEKGPPNEAFPSPFPSIFKDIPKDFYDDEPLPRDLPF